MRQPKDLILGGNTRYRGFRVTRLQNGNYDVRPLSSGAHAVSAIPGPRHDSLQYTDTTATRKLSFTPENQLDGRKIIELIDSWQDIRNWQEIVALIDDRLEFLSNTPNYRPCGWWREHVDKPRFTSRYTTY